MKRRTRFIIGFAAAAITFGTLTATLGPARFHHHRLSHSHAFCDKSCDNSNSKQSPDKKGNIQSQSPVPGKE
ncbi:MAG: hypothetical protein HGA37_02780 [Lentimicrobium sp.]|nr:hypothetical protein [Lentimicrobium sp.]